MPSTTHTWCLFSALAWQWVTNRLWGFPIVSNVGVQYGTPELWCKKMASKSFNKARQYRLFYLPNLSIGYDGAPLVPTRHAILIIL
ncbi:hypothetical protein GGR50DRAFT_654498 [Xylaria sp. CBS 124048]|nr:hypothetical protein GGR50DRAFT_654498 [Xylaria sp. CBS 124048]